MNACTFNSVNGMNKDCEVFLSAVKGFLITDPSFSFATVDAAKSLENYRTAIQEDLDMFPTRPFRMVEPTDAEPVTETDGYGVNYVDSFNAPSMNVYMSSSPCDFAEMVKLGAAVVRIIPVNENGAKMATITKTGVVKGFSAQLIARPLSAKSRDNKTQQYMVIVNFTNVDEFKETIVISDNNTLNDYLEQVPEGYTQVITSALSGASMSVRINKRCIDSELADGTWTAEIIESFGCAAPSISVGALSSGVSVLTIYATGTTPLAAGQEINFRLVQKTGDVYDAITNVLTASL